MKRSLAYHPGLGRSLRLFFIALPLVTCNSLISVSRVTAQITPDSSLGVESSVVNPDVIKGIPSDRLTGGATRGSNLFHSFQEFNVGEGRGAYFSNPDGIINILTRVTGGNPSNILGTLGVLGNANLFLINPKGIFFGTNAQLDLGGSFFGSTADSVLFDNNFEFSSSNPQAVPQLTINIPIGLRFRENPGSITIGNNQGTINNPTPESPTLLEVQPQKTLALVGGEINLNGQRLRAPGGRIELGGLQAAGTVGINNDDSLTFPTGVELADISVNASELDVTSGGGGSIAINARNINILGGSDICAGIGADAACGGLASDFGSVGSQAGDITLNALENITIADSGSRVNNNVNLGAVGNGGNINIQARSLSLNNGAQIQADAEGQGNSGKVTIVASDTVTLDGRDSNGFPSGIFTLVEEEAKEGSNSGGIDITTDSLFITNRAQLASTTEGTGDPGDITINAQNQVYLLNSIIISEVTEGKGVGNGGDINIKTGFLLLKNGSSLLADTENQGNAGNIIIDARDAVILEGQGPAALNPREIIPSQISTTVESNAVGEAGNINISTGLLSIKDRGFIDSFTKGKGNAGDISINARDIQLTNNSLLRTRTDGLGNAGDISINARDIELNNTSVMNSGVVGEGNGGDINIQTDSLSLKNGSQINSFIFSGGNGEAGNIKITASDSITLSGIDTDSFSSALFTITERGSSGSAGDIFVQTGNLRITDGAIIGATTFNSSDGGNIFINARNFEAVNGGQVVTATRSSGNAGQITFKVAENMTISGFDSNFQQRLERARNFIKNRPEQRFREPSDIVINEGAASGIFANTAPDSTGKGGSIFIDSKQVTIKDSGTITATSADRGEAGNIELKADNLTLDRGKITAESGSATGGNIKLDIKDLLLLRRNSQISATAGSNQGGGDGGNVNINTGLLVAFPKENSDITANAFQGNGGNVQINAAGIYGIQFRDKPTPKSDITASSEFGRTGTVELITPDTDPEQGLVELPENLTDPTDQIAQNPCQKGTDSSFTITGRGGLPSSPNDFFTSDNVRVDLVKPSSSSSNSQSSTINQPTTQPTAKQIIPAQGWVLNDKGEVVLTAYDPNTTSPQRTSKPTTACPASF